MSPELRVVEQRDLRITQVPALLDGAYPLPVRVD